MTINIGNECISNSANEKILGVIFDNKLNFNTHVSKLCKKAGQKLYAVGRISKSEKTDYECFHIFAI